MRELAVSLDTALRRHEATLARPLGEELDALDALARRLGIRHVIR